ncbi:MAG TPA: hypothetical protein VD969_12340 [Symbiobacteriaceae bacterium]|nr:hypothetical protein [Symbiobacteriaceae bacterium]
MKAPYEISNVWSRFAGVPMETFTKGWWYDRCKGTARQRTVDEMVEHRRMHGTGGNCFDLALWLHHEFRTSGTPARIVGHDLCTPDAHVAVIAIDRTGSEFLCDLGDQWLQPILVDTCSDAFSDGWHTGFFPGREVRILRSTDLLHVSYRRSNGKVGNQCYDLQPLSDDALKLACHHSQNLLRRPFCEMLLPHPATGTTEHWEYDRGSSFWNLEGGAVVEEPCQTQGEWIARIVLRTGISADVISAAFTADQGFAAQN